MREVSLRELSSKLGKQIADLLELREMIANLSQPLPSVAAEPIAVQHVRHTADLFKAWTQEAFMTEAQFKALKQREAEEKSLKLKREQEENKIKKTRLEGLQTNYSRRLEIVARSLQQYLSQGRLVINFDGVREALSTDYFDMSKLSVTAWGYEQEGIKTYIIQKFSPKDRAVLLKNLPSSPPIVAPLAMAAAASAVIATTQQPIATPAAIMTTPVPVLLSGESDAPARAGEVTSSSEDEWGAERNRIVAMLLTLQNERHIPWLFNARRHAKMEFLTALQSKLNGEARGETLKRDLGEFIFQEMQSERGSLIKAGIFSRRTASFIESLEQKAAALPLPPAREFGHGP